MLWTFRPDGRLEGELETTTMITKYDEGTWMGVAAGAGVLCYQWTRWGNGRRDCRIISVSNNRIRAARPRDDSESRIWEIKDEGDRSRQIIAGLRSSGSQQRTASGRASMIRRPAVAAGTKPPVIAAAEEFVRVPAGQIKPLMSGTIVDLETRSGNAMNWTFGPDGRLDGEVITQGGNAGVDDTKASGRGWH